MKLNKTLALLALVAGGLLAGATLQAQDEPKTPPPGGQPGGPGVRQRPNVVEQMAKELNLTDDQKVKVKAAMQEMVTKSKAVHDDTSLSTEEKRTKMKAIREEHTAKMKTILTPEQFEKWQKHMQRQRPQPPKHGQSGNGDHGDKGDQNQDKGGNPPKQD